MIRIKNFSKIYEGFRAVDNLNLEIEKGDVFGFIGPNGAGKTTTIRFLATLLKPTYGDATIDGMSVRSKPTDIKRLIGYMPDNFGVYHGMKVWEYLDFFAAAYGLKGQSRKKVIEDVLELLDLQSIRDDYVNGLSRGVKQRLCLAKTLLHNPPVLLLDEPASGLDPRARIYIKGILKELRNLGKTILISSHILSELEDCCTRVGIIEKGKLLAAGPVRKVLEMIRSTRRIQVILLEKVDRAREIIEQQAQVREMEVSGQKIEFEFDGDDEAILEFHRKLLGDGFPVVWFQEVPLSLEEAFLRMTKGEIQ